MGVYLAEYKHPGANITNFGDGIWWAIVTITTVGYGEYFPLTLVGRAIAVFVMLSGIGIAVTIVTIFSQRRLKSIESRLIRKGKIDGIEKLTEDEEGQKSITIGGKTLAALEKYYKKELRYKHVQDIICRVCVCACTQRFRENYRSRRRQQDRIVISYSSSCFLLNSFRVSSLVGCGILIPVHSSNSLMI